MYKRFSLELILGALLVLSLAQPGRAQEAVLSFQTEPSPAWVIPLDLTLGTFMPANTEQIFGTPFTLRGKFQQITFKIPKTTTYTMSDWWIRNEMTRPVSIARFASIVSYSGYPRGRVYGVTWASSTPLDNYLKPSALYKVRTLQGGKWVDPARLFFGYANYIKWVPLQPGEEMKVHSGMTEGEQPPEALAMTIPFRIDGFEEEAILHWVRP